MNLGVLKLSFLISLASGVELLPDDDNSVTAAMSAIIPGMLTYSPWASDTPGATPGMFQQPYYWWEAGLAWNALLDWSVFTKNNTYDTLIKQAIQFQSGANWDFMTENQTSVEGNDDQGFWGVTVMNAAEKNFTSPDKGYPPWLYFAQATFNKMAGRWDTSHCNGGLRWQIYTWNAGYDYKNMVSNGLLFHLAARLARFTNNGSYVDWAERTWDWASDIGLLEAGNDPDTTSDPLQVFMHVYDGSQTEANCSNVVKAEWTYDQGLMISGCAYLYAYTQDEKWLNRTKMLWSRAAALFGSDNSTYFPDNSIVYEASCMTSDESVVRCSNDQRCFKGLLLNMMGLALKLIPELADDTTMYRNIKASAQAAAWSCSGGSDGVTCGLSWLHEGWDGWYGLGEQICALNAFNTLWYNRYDGPYRAQDLPEIYKVQSSGSSGNSSSGSNSTYSSGGDVYGYGAEAGMNTTSVEAQTLNLTKSDTAGAGVLTAFVLLFIIGGSVWILL